MLSGFGLPKIPSFIKAVPDHTALKKRIIPKKNPYKNPPNS